MGRRTRGLKAEGLLKYSVVNYGEIVKIHHKILVDFGGSYGMNSEGNLAFLVDHIKNHEYKGGIRHQVFSKSAYMLQRIVTGHPFTDGNKRTGYNVTQTFLAENGYILKAGDEEVIAFLTKLAEKGCSIAFVKKWLHQNAKKTDKA